MTTWTQVEPLSDEPQDRSFWEPHQFKIGDRVRVRLSGECQHLFGYTLDRSGGTASIPPHPHLDEEQGRTGRIVFDGRLHEMALARGTGVMNQHWWIVDFDVESPMLRGCTYAATELELLS